MKLATLVDSPILSNNFSYIIDGYVNSVYSVISEINFGDDTSLQLDEAGTPLNFTYTGTSGHTTLVGSDFGNNTFNLGVGGDTVTAGTAGNTFNFDEGDGQATVDTNGSLAASGVLNLGSDVSSSDVTLQADSSGDLTVSLSTGDSITFSNDLSTIVGSDGQYGDYSVIGQINLGVATTITLDESGGPLNFTYTGTSGHTTLSGTDFGSNTFNLGTGGDTVTGGDGSNTFNFSSGDGAATISVTRVYGTNTLNIGSSLTDEDLWFEHTGNDLKIDVIGTSDQITVSDWFSGSTHKMQEITAGTLKIDSQVSALVSAMATYSSNNTSFDPTSALVMPTDTTLQAAIASAWHS